MGKIIKEIEVCGVNKCKTISAMFDSGSTMNIIDPDLVRELGEVEVIRDDWNLAVPGGVQTGVMEIELASMDILGHKIPKPRFLVREIVEPYDVIVGAIPMQEWGIELIMERETPEIKFMHPKASSSMAAVEGTHLNVKKELNSMESELTPEEEKSVKEGIEWDLTGRFKDIDELIKEVKAAQASFPGGGYYGVPFSRLIPYLEKNRELWVKKEEKPAEAEEKKFNIGDFIYNKITNEVINIDYIEPDGSVTGYVYENWKKTTTTRKISSDKLMDWERTVPPGVPPVEIEKLKFIVRTAAPQEAWDILNKKIDVREIKTEEELHKNIKESLWAVPEGFEVIPRDQVPTTAVYQEVRKHPWWGSVTTYFEEIKAIIYLVPTINPNNIAFKGVK